MKRKIIIAIIASICLCFFVGCRPKKLTNFEKMTNALNSINLPEKTSKNLTLPKEINGFVIEWSSNKTESISNDGIVTLQPNEVEVILNATITSNGESAFRLFSIIVEKDNEYLELQNALKNIDVLTELTTNKIDLPSEVEGYSVEWKTSNSKVITTEGKVTLGKEDVNVTLTASVNYNGKTISQNFEVLVKANPVYGIIENAISKVEIPESTYENLKLPLEQDGVSISWSTSRAAIMTKTGVITRDFEDSSVVLTATYSYEGIKITESYFITVKGYTDSEKLAAVLDDISFNENLTNNIILKDTFRYGISARWESSDENVLTNYGYYTYDENVQKVTLKLIATLGSEEMTKEFVFNLREKVNLEKEHLIIERANELNESGFSNLEFKNGRIVLVEGAIEGTYTSDVIETIDFTSLVGSWASTSSKNATVEVFVKARVNGTWSDYISYSKFGLGLQNGMKDQVVSLIQLSDDEVKVLNGKNGNAIQYKIVLRRDDATVVSPKFSLMAFALNSSGYNYNVDLSKYPTSVIHTVPKLYQQVVPTIGNSICSPTSSTMLLKYKGEDFSEYDTFEHRYIANLFRDYGNEMFGNWVYCTVGMGAFGYDAYVARYYSVEELVEHLAVMGPCAISVKGQMTSDKKNYNTAGHLLVAIGYEYDANGNLIIVCNDPNVSEVECRYSYSVINNTWRGVIYTIE